MSALNHFTIIGFSTDIQTKTNNDRTNRYMHIQIERPIKEGWGQTTVEVQLLPSVKQTSEELTQKDVAIIGYVSGWTSTKTGYVNVMLNATEARVLGDGGSIAKPAQPKPTTAQVQAKAREEYERKLTAVVNGEEITVSDADLPF